MAGLWVGGLPWYVTEGALHDWCGWHGVFPTWVQVLRGRADATKCSCVLHFHDAAHRDYSKRLLPYYYDGCRISVREQDAAKAKSAGVPKAAPAKAIPPWRVPAAKAAAAAPGVPAQAGPQAPAEAVLRPVPAEPVPRAAPAEPVLPPAPAEPVLAPPHAPAEPVLPPLPAEPVLAAPEVPAAPAFDDLPLYGELKEEAADVPADPPRDDADQQEGAEISPTVLADSPSGSSSTEMATIHEGPAYETEAWPEHSTFRNPCFLLIFVNPKP